MKIKLFLALMLFSGISQGTAFLDRQIDFILINADTGIHFTTVEPMENPDNCNQSDFYKVENGGTYESEIYSMLLAKKAAKEPVSFDITGCTANGRQKIMWVR